jgi:hypothetical protein
MLYTLELSWGLEPGHEDGIGGVEFLINVLSWNLTEVSGQFY